MRLYQSTDSDRRQNPTTCGADRRLETTFTMDLAGQPYDAMTVRITVNGGQVHIDIDTTKCGPGVVVRVDDNVIQQRIPPWLSQALNEGDGAYKP